ncbi:MAG: hypothetical protein A3H06_01255 [Candidatus Colwellbacteria bacterium RIFCSPLOWO2_12_FULL_44_13]|uniref:Uncharacterized protein n=2 Tax=Candidatus Colwelliibacteriota TaxID=1817904 RepID=A0A1G1Z613_9BACT|nr:MAG: hypothetical protein A3I31_03015 [Candidatus Colwellbacteria bacterium RIFCSPLOWO2_02_FULL_44_20b]OGY61462.1 MAG: hypothetical protein A3H06_01255 [Candidatus Colwellbacteria bacterium RIFCSPLOWO2_12_FULL_44_13]
MPMYTRKMTNERLAEWKDCFQVLQKDLDEVEDRAANGGPYYKEDYGRVLEHAFETVQGKGFPIWKYLPPLERCVVKSAARLAPRHGDNDAVARVIDLAEIMRKGRYKKDCFHCQKLLMGWSTEECFIHLGNIERATALAG